MHRNLMSLVLAIGICASSFTPASANGKLDEILQKMQQAAAKVSSVKAHLGQETKDRTLGGAPQTSSGNLTFSHSAKGDKLRIDYDRPSGQVILVVGDEIKLYQPSIKQVTVTRRSKLASKNEEFAIIATPYNTGSLKQRYDVAYIGDEQVNGVAASKLELKPKNRASSVKSLIIWVSQEVWLPLKYQVQEPDAVSTFTLSQSSLNPKLDSSTFELKLPPGTSV